MDGNDVASAGKCPACMVPAHNATFGGRSNRDWWPNQLNLKILHQNSPLSDPMGKDFNYAEEFKKLDFEALKKDLFALMTDSQDWWPADFGHYGPLFIRMAWHSAGTYRIGDGRGGAGSGTQRFAPLNSWPDNVNLDKARRLLWPIKQKYGKQDLLGRPDDPRRQLRAGVDGLQDLRLRRRARGCLGARGGHLLGHRENWLGDERYSGDRDLENPLAAVQMGLIYVNPEGPNGKPDPLAAARDIRETFKRMAMNDEETVALIAGGHTLRQDPRRGRLDSSSAPSPRAPPSRSRASAGRTPSAAAKATTRSAAAWKSSGPRRPTKWSNDFFENLFGYEWELTKSPAGAYQWTAEGRRRRRHGPGSRTTRRSVARPRC